MAGPRRVRRCDGARAVPATPTAWWPTQSGDPSTRERIEQRVRRHIVPHLGAWVHAREYAHFLPRADARGTTAIDAVVA